MCSVPPTSEADGGIRRLDRHVGGDPERTTHII